MKSSFDRIAEERIARAVESGEFDALPGAGQPLQLDDDLLVPREVRMANRILKNAGCLPPEVEKLKASRDSGNREPGAEPAGAAARRRMVALQMRLEGSGRFSRSAWSQYAPAILRRFAGGK